MCEMVFTSDQKFFDKIGYEESKRYFEESYKFICEYKNLGERNIISAVVHMDFDFEKQLDIDKFEIIQEDEQEYGIY